MNSLSARLKEKHRSFEPRIIIGGGPGCRAQLLVTYDVLGMFDDFTPSFAKKYANFNQVIKEAFQQYRDEVMSGQFPGSEHVYGVLDEIMELIENEFGPA